MTTTQRSRSSGSAQGTPRDATLDKLWRAADELDRKISEEIRGLRGTPRVRYRRGDIAVLLRPSSGVPQERVAVGRDLSVGGIGLFSRGFLYPGTVCELKLERQLGGTDTVVGAVAHCSHVAGPWHQVGVKFHQKIHPALFLTPSAAKELAANQTPNQQIDGDVLVVEPNELDRRLITFHIKTLGGVGVEADSAEVALARSGDDNQPPLLAVIANIDALSLAANADAGERESESLLEQIRSAARCAVINLRDQGAAQKVVTEYTIVKPVTQGEIASILAAALGGYGAGETPIRSTLTDEKPAEGDLAELLQAAVRQIQQVGHELVAATLDGDVDTARRRASHLKFLGTSFGYVPLASNAGEATRALDATQDTAMCKPTLDTLAGICRRVVC